MSKNKLVIQFQQKSWWIVTVLTLLGVILTACLGIWQLNRAAQKQELKNNIQNLALQPPLQDLAWAKQALELNEHKTVNVKGYWLEGNTVYLENRQLQGKPGFFVMTPLVLSGTQNSRVIMVQRGWIPRNFLKRDELSPIQTQKNEVEITARIAHWPSRLYEFNQVETGKIRQNIEWNSFQKEISQPLLSFSLIQTGIDSDGLVRKWDFNFINVDVHYGYAFQWFSFAILMLILYFGFFYLRLKRLKQSS